MYPRFGYMLFPLCLGDFGMFLDEKCSWSFMSFS